MSTTKKLQEALHLSAPEAKLYLAALEHSHNTVSRLGEVAKLPRTAVYGPLKKLMERGLVSEVKLGKRTHYQALPPQQLEHILEHEKAQLAHVVDDLTQTINMPQDDLVVRHFRGARGVLASLATLLESTESGGVWRTIEHPTLTLAKWDEAEVDEFIKKRVEKKISTQIINPATKLTPWLEQLMTDKETVLMDVLQLSASEYPITAGFLTNGSELLILNYRSIPSATLISNPDIAKTFESMHKLVWERYRR